MLVRIIHFVRMYIKTNKMQVAKVIFYVIILVNYRKDFINMKENKFFYDEILKERILIYEKNFLNQEFSNFEI